MAALLCLVSLPAEAAKLWISEYAQIATATGNVAQIAREPALVEQTPVDFTAGATQSAVFGGATQYVRLLCDVRCSVLFGSNPTATTNSKVLPANTPEYFGVRSGDRISVIANP